MAAKDFSTDLQKLFLEMMISDAQCYVRVQNIYNSENFDRSLRKAAKFIDDYSKQYSDIPTVQQIHAETGLELNPITDVNQTMEEWFLNEFESFSRHESVKRVILECADLIEKGEYDPIEKKVKDAVQISLTRDLGVDYFEDPRARLMELKDNNGQVSTGWPVLDRKLFGGFNRGELEIFAGGSGSGKSLFMQNLAVNWAMAGLNGAFITLELSQGLCAMRIDSMMVGVPSKDIFKNLDDVELKVKMIGKNSGSLRIKYMPAQSNVNDLRAYLKELQIQTGKALDYICVDYLDLLMPVSAKVSPSDLFVKDKYVSEELRNLAKEFNVVLVSASQLNRSAVEEIEFDHSHISGGISKINTADNVFGIFTSRSMRESGRYQIQLMKTRSSSGVGQKVELQFDIDSLRIFDDGSSETNVQGPAANKTTELMNKLKTKSTVATDSDDETPMAPVKADVQSTKLKEMINALKK